MPQQPASNENKEKRRKLRIADLPVQAWGRLETREPNLPAMSGASIHLRTLHKRKVGRARDAPTHGSKQAIHHTEGEWTLSRKKPLPDETNRPTRTPHTPFRVAQPSPSPSPTCTAPLTQYKRPNLGRQRPAPHTILMTLLGFVPDRRTDRSDTANSTVEFGGTNGGFPREPYASSGGTTSSRWPPTFMPSMPAPWHRRMGPKTKQKT